MKQDFIDIIKHKYFLFEGRSRRREYWMFALYSAIISVATAILDVIFGTRGVGNLGLLNTLYSLAILLPSLGLAVRRLHDTNRSGWWLLLAVVPILGPIVLLIFFVLDSTPGDNRYGPNPKGPINITATPVAPQS